MNTADSRVSDRAQLIDQALDGGLGVFLAEGRAEGTSWRMLALIIRDRTGIDCAGESIRVWATQFGVEAPDKIGRAS